MPLSTPSTNYVESQVDAVNEDQTEIQVKAEAIKDNGSPGKVLAMTVNLKDSKIKAKLSNTGEDVAALPLQNEDEPPEGTEDMTSLNYLHEPAILYNLRTRFYAACPYTYTGEICMAMNPYQWLDLYTPEMHEKYLNMDKKSDLPPHGAIHKKI